MLVDKYRPRTLDNLMVHKEEATKNLIAPGDRPHLLFYGPSGAGKKTLIMTLLREMFGPSAEKAGTRKIELELTTVSRNHDVELNPSDAGFKAFSASYNGEV